MEPELEMMNKQAVQIADLIYGALTKPRPTARDSRCFDLAGVLLAERGEERGWNPDTKSKFAKEEDIDKVLDSLLFEERMSLNFEPESHPQPEMMRVVGILSLGAYSKRYPLDMPADGKGAKGGGVMSRTHATGSAITYGKRYLKTMMFNLHFKDTDDDGNAAAGLTVNVYAPLMDAIENGHTIGDVTAAYIRALKAAKTDTEKAAFEAAANKRKAELK